MNPQVLIDGPVSAYRLENKSMNKVVYLFGDQHSELTSENNCKSDISIDIQQYIHNIILNNPTIQYDIFIEQGSLEFKKDIVNTDYNLHTNDTLTNTIKYFEKLKNLNLHNFRLHYIDIRWSLLIPIDPIIDKISITTKIFDRIYFLPFYKKVSINLYIYYIIFFLTYIDYLKSTINKKINKQENIEELTFEHFKSNDKQIFITSLNKYFNIFGIVSDDNKKYSLFLEQTNIQQYLFHIQKYLYKLISNETIHIIEHLINNINDVYVKIHRYYYNLLLDIGKIIQFEDLNNYSTIQFYKIKSISDIILKNLMQSYEIDKDITIFFAYFVDIYTIYRLQKQYIKNCIIYAGNAHITNIVNELVTTYNYTETHTNGLIHIVGYNYPQVGYNGHKKCVDLTNFPKDFT